MPGWLKALLVVIIVIIVLVVGVVIAGVYWISRNKDAWIARGKEVMTEGREFGRDTDNQGCVRIDFALQAGARFHEHDLEWHLHARMPR